jgi:3-oxoadipate enol-lactonase
MSIAGINGIDLYYESYGEGRAIVFAHGGAGNHLVWWQQVPVFSRNYRCITIDHRGFGMSPDVPAGPGSAAYVEDARCLLDHLGIDEAVMVGQSMGGITALGFAATYPHRTIALVLTSTTGGNNIPEIAEIIRGNLPTDQSDAARKSLGSDFAAREPAKAFLYHQITALNRKAPHKIPPIPAFPVEVLNEYHIPTLLVVGEEDTILNAPAAMTKMMDVMAQHVPHARLVKFPKAGHSVYFEQPDRFNRVLAEFLRGC